MTIKDCKVEGWVLCENSYSIFVCVLFFFYDKIKIEKNYIR